MKQIFPGVSMPSKKYDRDSHMQRRNFATRTRRLVLRSPSIKVVLAGASRSIRQ